jgi:ribosome-binding factor A
MIDRINRISEEVKKEMYNIIKNDLKDPRISDFLSVTNLKVTKDLKHAKVYISVLGSEEDKNNTIKALKSAQGYIRREIGHRLTIRHTPEFSFILDNSIEEGIHITELINKTINHDEQKDNEQKDNEQKDTEQKDNEQKDNEQKYDE